MLPGSFKIPLRESQKCLIDKINELLCQVVVAAANVVVAFVAGIVDVILVRNFPHRCWANHKRKQNKNNNCTY